MPANARSARLCDHCSSDWFRISARCALSIRCKHVDGGQLVWQLAGAELQLTCDVIHEKCPTFKYGNEGPSNQCVYDDVPDVLDNVLHHAIPPDGPGLREVTYGSQKLVVENTCFYAGNRARIDDERDVKRGLCKYPGSWRDYLEKLGVVGRDTAKHP